MAKPIPYPFVLEALARAKPYTKPMFGCTAVYVGEKIVLILRDRPEPREDRGIWVATTEEHHATLAPEFPSMRSIALFGPGVTGWQVLPVSAVDFEEAALKACALVLKGDPRVGKVPKARKPRKKSAEKKAKKRSRRPK